jgi:hypothetical protein
MHGHHVTKISESGPVRVPAVLQIALLALGVIGLGAFFYGAFTGAEVSRYNAWNGFLVSMLFFWFLSMGAAAFLAINYVVGAKWFVSVKRLPEALASYTYRGGFVFPVILALLGVVTLYSGAREGADYPYEGTVKDFWLSAPVQTIKTIMYTTILSFATFILVKASRSEANGNAPALRSYREKVAIGFLIVFTFVFSLFGWEVVMSLEPKWFSTMWGVYCFAGAFVSALCVMMMMSFWLRGKYPEYVVEKRQLHDMGTFVMGFSTFWIYIAFSQFMLIWYANLPDETFFYLKRYEHGWLMFTIAIPVLKWIIPFFLLMPPQCRTNVFAQLVAAIAILTGQAMDLWWVVGPVDETQATTYLYPTVVNVLTFLGFFGFFSWSVLGYLASTSTVPVEDPDLLSSVNGEYLHA